MKVTGNLGRPIVEEDIAYLTRHLRVIRKNAMFFCYTPEDNVVIQAWCGQVGFKIHGAVRPVQVKNVLEWFPSILGMIPVE